jgi:hypothetical protein
MATLRASKHAAAREAAFSVMRADIDRVIDGGESRFPSHSSFIASDLVTDAKIRDAHAHGNAVVIVDEHENVTVLPAPDPSVGERESERFWDEMLAHRRR